MLRLRHLLPAVLLLVTSGTALAQNLDTPSVTSVSTGTAFLGLKVTAGNSGAPAGFTVQWMTKSAYDALGGWPTDPYATGFDYSTFSGTATFRLTPGQTSFTLAPGASVNVYPGDLFDQTGLGTNYTGECAAATQYAVRVFAEASLTAGQSAPTATLLVTTSTPLGCTYTVGFWKTHGPAGCVTGNNTDVWPVTSLTLGTVTYTDAQLCSILNTPAGGNGLISLAHQLIAAKLNIANGADGSSVAGTIAAADALIGGLIIPPVGSGFLNPSASDPYTSTLDDYNNGLVGPPHCGTVPARPTSWTGLKIRYR